MKKNAYLFIFLTLLMTSCKKDKLPEPTQEGKNTFGCLVNGQLFREYTALSPGSSRLTAQYSNFNNQSYFIVGTQGKIKDSRSHFMNIVIKDILVEAGKTYSLASRFKSGAASADYSAGDVGNSKEYLTSSDLQGELVISRIDEKGVSGTFWFDAVAKDGEKVEVREGRFDVSFN